VPEVRTRITAAREGIGEPNAIRGFTGLKELFYEDRTTGRIKEERHNILEFKKPEALQYGTVVEDEGTLDGFVIRIGGKDQSAHVIIQDGEKTYACITTKPKARELREFLLEADKPVRLFGKGKWTRAANGTWELNEFKIRDHEPLNGDDLQQVLARMRQIPGSGWDKIDDPLGELDEIRKGTIKIQ